MADYNSELERIRNAEREAGRDPDAPWIAKQAAANAAKTPESEAASDKASAAAMTADQAGGQAPVNGEVKPVASAAPAPSPTPTPSPAPATPAAPAAQGGLQIGDTKKWASDGITRKYIGGDPADKDKSWQVVQAAETPAKPEEKPAAAPVVPKATVAPESAYGIDIEKKNEALAKLDKISYSLPSEQRAAFDNRRKEIQSLVDDAEARFKGREQTAQYAQVADILGQAMAKLGAGYYGLKTGYDLSGVPFKTQDWQKELDRIYDHYDKTVTRNLKQKESVEQDQQAAEKEAREVGQNQAKTLADLVDKQTTAQIYRGRDITTVNDTNARTAAAAAAGEAKGAEKAREFEGREKDREADRQLKSGQALQKLIGDSLKKGSTEAQQEIAARAVGATDEEIENAKSLFHPFAPNLRQLISKKTGARAEE